MHYKNMLKRLLQLSIFALLLIASPVYAWGDGEVSNSNWGSGRATPTKWRGVSTSGMVVFYPFQNDVNDYSGNGYDATLVGGVTWNSTAGYDGRGAYYFDGASDYLNLPNILSNFSDEVTLLMRLKLDSNTPITDYSGLVAFDNFYTATHYPYGSSIYIGIFRNDRLGAIANGGFDKSQWHLFTITNKNVANGYNIYQNLNTVYSGTGEDAVYLRATPVIGRYASGYNYKGYMSEVVIYNRVLEPWEIGYLANN